MAIPALKVWGFYRFSGIIKVYSFKKFRITFRYSTWTKALS